MTDQQPEVTQEIRVPEELAPGVYANGILAWWVETDMTLDFFVNLPPEGATGEDGRPMWVIPQQVVARVKMTPGMAVYLGVQIADALTKYEQTYGTISRLKDQPPLIPPSLDGEAGGTGA